MSEPTLYRYKPIKSNYDTTDPDPPLIAFDSWEEQVGEWVPVDPTHRLVWCFAHNVNVSKTSVNPDEYDDQCGAGLIFGTPCDIGVGGVVRLIGEPA